MTKVVAKIYADGRIVPCDEQMNLEEMQKFVGGYIEAVPARTLNCSLVVDEESLLKSKPLNKPATEMMHHKYVGQQLRGDALLIKGKL